ncbi:MAG: polyprenyl diphosphate synthase [Candidatus Saccharibacteria bacterium]|nr:polyprenyl diphosphate synthase [Candidatus Saccharibacteria bacterium]
MTTASSTQVPQHIGIILDGNRRWAAAKNLPKLEGHRAGYETLKTVATYAFKKGASFISAFVFSTENWGRSQQEVDYLMKLLLWVAKNEVDSFNKQNIRVRFLGEEEKLSPNVLKAMRDAEEKTKNNTAGTLLLCLNYGGKQEIASAATKFLRANPTADSITVEDISSNIYEPSVPDIDLLIRTSGEQRLSNFMLWRAAYSELYFTEAHWPAFTEAMFDEAIEAYSIRQRRFGT